MRRLLHGLEEAKTEQVVERFDMETPRRTVKRRARRTVEIALRSIRAQSLGRPRRLLPAITQTMEIPPASSFNHQFRSEENSPSTLVNINVDLDRVSDQCFSTSASLDDSYQDSSSANRVNQIQNWAVNNGVTQVATNQLLSLLRVWLPSDGFPKDARTLLKTPRQIDVIERAGGEYYYFGVTNRLRNCFKIGMVSFEQYLSKFKSINHLITIKVGIDGVPISKSSNLQFWPILFSVDQCKDKSVYVAALYYGSHKPNNVDDFLSDFVAEMKELETNGLYFNNVNYVIRIRCLVADAPARSFLKCIKNHNAYYGCERCSRKGKWKGRVIYPVRTLSQLYTDNSFKLFEFPKHHQGITPLSQIDIGLITQIPLDYMHLCCLGIMKKLILSWIEGPGHFKLRRSNVNIISNRLISLRNQMPTKFSRKPRSLDEVRNWKATEFRTFMLYTGPFVLKGVLDSKRYEHFLLFHAAMYILCSNNVKDTDWVNFAEELLEKFVNLVPIHYHSEFLSYNMHSVQHLAQDVRNHGSVDNFSAFEFESYLYKLKQLLRKNNKHHLKQVVNRILEKDGIENLSSVTTNNSSTSVKDGDFILVDGNICKIQRIDSDCAYVDVYENVFNVKHYPCSSSLLSIFKLGEGVKRESVSLNKLSKPCLCLRVEDKYYVIPLAST